MVFRISTIRNWAEQNPCAILQNNMQHQISLKAWTGIIGNILVQSFILLWRLSGDEYLAFSTFNLPESLEVPLQTCLDMWGTAHANHQVVQCLNHFRK